MAPPLLTREYVLSRLEYKDGELYWKERPREEFKREQDYKRWNARYAGTRAGHLRIDGYEGVKINKVRYLSHRIIFLMHHGYLPEQIDHIDGNRKNNKIQNLRLATEIQNNCNAKLSSRNSSGYKGVSWSKRNNAWIARVYYNKKVWLMGCFKDIENAAQAAREAREVLHGEFARHE